MAWLVPLWLAGDTPRVADERARVGGIVAEPEELGYQRGTRAVSHLPRRDAVRTVLRLVVLLDLGAEVVVVEEDGDDEVGNLAVDVLDVLHVVVSVQHGVPLLLERATLM